MSTIIDQAKNAINVWNDTRNNSTAVSNYFNQGAYFEISIEDFEAWNSNNPTEIHAYMGLEIPPGAPNFALHLFSVDNITDQKPVESHQAEYLEKLKKSIYQRAILPNVHFNMSLGNADEIEPLDALQASTQWTLHKDLWLSQQTDLVQTFIIPFSDLKKLFLVRGAESVVVLPALKEIDNMPNVFQIDLMLWGHTSEGIIGRYPKDFIKPAPPFSNPSHFQLLDYALS
ncbi:hypothetical protein [Aureispira anguillae]|uniref:Uncharacterized protein n=1 Tax=Aureispira anguillae TaxID=2864201 RepID=A0A915YJ86_9BACT|nr:hypothetical protein [Aureispira anguillae]BDS14070.1 hypothetical protein AsAng_0048360 [Aureispira anguillae]